MSKKQLLLGVALAPLVLAGWSGAARAETVVSVTQYSYDDEERLQCTAIRMNPAIFTGALPSACTLGTEGTDGPDRITKNTYDAAGQLTQVQRAYATPLQQTYAAYTYSLTGKQTSVTDANGNKASLSYDGFDRLTQWNFPDKVTAGTVSTTDYEAYGYDDDGNRISLRKRDGQTITYGYDALNRMTLKDVPGTTADVNFSYDLLGAQLSARFASTGLGITNTFDALSRLQSTTNNMGTTARTLNYAYDPAGNRAQLTYPDSSYFTYTYDALNRLTAIKEAGTTAIVSTIYDAQGRVGTQTRGAVTTTLIYDGMSRPTSWTDNLAETPPTPTSDVTTMFTYNAANQIASKTRSNAAYSFTGYVNVSRPYVVNGLNQYTTAGAAMFGYDNSGNLTGDGTNSYTYDVENRMKTATIGTVANTLNYDPLGRLWQVVTPTKTLEFTHDGDSIVMELNGVNVYKYIHGPGDDAPIIAYTPTGRQSYQVDYQRSIISVADATGAPIHVNSYDEYGIGPSANVGRFQYTGQAWISQLGLYYYKARMYSPTLGRFMQTDPIGYKDQLNLYAYVGNDPTNSADSTGRKTTCITNIEEQWTTCDVEAKPDGDTGPAIDSTVNIFDSRGNPAINVSIYNNPKYEEVTIPMSPLKGDFCPNTGAPIDPNKTGPVQYVGSSFEVNGVLGMSVSQGAFVTRSGVYGRYYSIGFQVGLGGSAGEVTGVSDNLAAFSGGSDTFSYGYLLDDGQISYGSNGKQNGYSTSVLGKGTEWSVAWGYGDTKVHIDGCL